MPWWAWFCFGVFLAAVVATAVFSVFAFDRLRRLAAVAAGIQARVDELALGSEELERRLAHNQERMTDLERHRARLETSFGRLRVLTSAFLEARRELTGARRRYLRK
jgi:hypothetical protein